MINRPCSRVIYWRHKLLPSFRFLNRHYQSLQSCSHLGRHCESLLSCGHSNRHYQSLLSYGGFNQSSQLLLLWTTTGSVSRYRPVDILIGTNLFHRVVPSTFFCAATDLFQKRKVEWIAIIRTSVGLSQNVSNQPRTFSVSHLIATKVCFCMLFSLCFAFPFRVSVSYVYFLRYCLS
jgi:hypothetical protein